MDRQSLPPTLSVKQYSKFFGQSTKTTYKEIKEGNLQICTRNGRKIKISREVVEAKLDGKPGVKNSHFDSLAKKLEALDAQTSVNPGAKKSRRRPQKNKPRPDHGPGDLPA